MSLTCASIQFCQDVLIEVKQYILLWLHFGKQWNYFGSKSGMKNQLHTDQTLKLNIKCVMGLSGTAISSLQQNRTIEQTSPALKY